MSRGQGVRRATVLMGVIWIGCLSGAAVAQPAAVEAHEWASGTHEALAAYVAGDDAGAQRLCARILASEQAGPVAQHDAAVIYALTLLRSAVRSDRVDGLGRLAQLGQEDPSLLSEPECHLAYGLAQAALAATADALEALERAAEGFAARGRPERQLAALVALADTWLRHGEWELTPRSVVERPPQGAAAIAAERRKQIGRVRTRAAAIPNSDAALAQIDLLLARHLLADAARAAEGRALLENVAAAETLNEPTAEALFLLAQRHEQDGHPAAALPLYERLQRDWQGELAQRAEQQRRELLRPQLVVDVPQSVRSGQDVPVALRVRGLGQVQFEVRQVDVEAWLNAPLNRGQESTLPVTGSLRASGEYDISTPPLGWWNSDGVTFTAEPGAYVVFAHATAADGQALVVKRLVLVSDLAALCRVGRDDVLVWATRAPEAEPAAADWDDAAIQARFWMQQSFKPTRATLAAGLGRFALPGEARLMTGKRWFCLVRAGAHVALCTGELSRSGAAPAGAAGVALFGGPLETRVGATCSVSGFLFGERAADRATTQPRNIELRGVDALDQVLFTYPLTVTSGGAFALDVPITAELAGKHVRLAVREQGRTLPNILPRVSLSVAQADDRSFRVRLDVAAEVARGALLPVRAQAWYPGGCAVRQAGFETWFHFYALPTEAALDDPSLVAVDRLEAPFDEEGRIASDWNLYRLPLPAGPLAVRARARVLNWEGRVGLARGDVLCDGGPAHAWLRTDPAVPQVGQDVRVRLGWYQPGGRAVLDMPDVAVRRVADDTVVARLRLHPTGVWLVSDVWRPVQPGPYELMAEIPGFEAPPLQARRRVEVAAAPPGTGLVAAQLTGRAAVGTEGGQAGIRVHLEGESVVSLLALVEDDSPRGGAVLPAFAGSADVFVPLPAGTAPGAHVAILATGRDGPRTLLTLDIETATEPPGSLLPAGPIAVWPGSTAAVSVSCPPALVADPGAMIVARVIDATATDFAGLRPPRGAAGIMTDNEIDMPVEVEAVSVGSRPLQVVTSDVLAEGATLWSRCQSVDGPTTPLEVRIPGTGLYKLIVAVQAPGRAALADAVLLDARRGVAAELAGPERLTLGDRAELGLRLSNGSAEAVTAAVWLEAGSELPIESVRVHDEGPRSMPVVREQAYEVSVPGGGETWVFVEIEAARVGPARLAARVAVPGQECSAGYLCEVLPVSSPPSETPTIQVERELFVWNNPKEPLAAVPMATADLMAQEAEEAAHRDEPEGTNLSAGPVEAAGYPAPGDMANWAPLQPGQRLRLGQYVLVRERIWAYEALREVEWSQRVPATCALVTGPPKEFATLGGRVGGRADTLTLRIRSLPTGSHESYYCLAVVSPGAGVFPLPEVRVGATAVPTSIAPAEIRVLVAPD